MKITFGPRYYFYLLTLLSSSPAVAINLGEQVTYQGSSVHGKLSAITQIDSVVYWTIQPDQAKNPLVGPADFFQPSAHRGPKEVISKSRTAKIRKLLADSKLFDEIHYLDPTTLLLGFDGYSVPLTVRSFTNNIAKLEIVGKQNEEHEHCLALNFNFENHSGNLIKLKTRSLDDDSMLCPLPPERRGSYVLKFVDALSLSLAIRKIQLTDQSELPCPKSGRTTSLQFLKIFLEGQGWYEKHGYLPEDIEKYREQVRELTEYSLSKTSEEIESSQKIFEAHLRSFSSPETREILRKTEKRVALFREFLSRFKEEDSSDFLGRFLSWLWKKDSAAYVKIFDNLIRNRSDVQKIYSEIEGQILVKYYPSGD